MSKQTLYEHTKHWYQRPRNPNQIEAEEHNAAGFNQWLAVGITRIFGTIQAFYALVGWMIGWIILASAGVWLFAKDSYPFPFLLFLSNLIQLWALPVLATGQQVLSRKQELQSDEAFSTTQRSFHDIEQIMLHLDAQDQAILEILHRLDAQPQKEQAQ